MMSCQNPLCVIAPRSWGLRKRVGVTYSCQTRYSKASPGHAVAVLDATRFAQVRSAW
jgi:hypothetical protein